MMTAGLVL
jgi:hypothetical protein